MAYLRRRLDGEELARRFRRDSLTLKQEDIERRYGAPPYWFLGENAGGNPTPSYDQFAGLLVDEQEREYAPAGPSARNRAYIRLPRGITARQSTLRGVLTTRPTDRLDYPRAGERITLRPLGFEDDRRWSMRVTQLAALGAFASSTTGAGRRVATGLVTFSTSVPQRDEIETARVLNQRDRALERRIESPASLVPKRKTQSSSMARPAAKRTSY